MKHNVEVSKSLDEETQWIKRRIKGAHLFGVLKTRFSALFYPTGISRKLAGLIGLICLLSAGAFAQVRGSTETDSPAQQERDPYAAATEAYKEARKANPLRSTEAVTEAYHAALFAAQKATSDVKTAQKAADAAVAAAGEQNYLVEDNGIFGGLVSRPRTASPPTETRSGKPAPSGGGTPSASTTTTSESNGCGTCGTRLDFTPQSGPGTTRTIEGYEIRHNLDNTYDVSTPSGHFYHVNFDAHGHPVFSEYYLVIGGPVVSSARTGTNSTTSGSATLPCENGPGCGSTGSCIGGTCAPDPSSSHCEPTTPTCGPSGPCDGGGACAPDRSKCQPTAPGCGPTQQVNPGTRIPVKDSKVQAAPTRQGASGRPRVPAAQVKLAPPVTRKR